MYEVDFVLPRRHRERFWPELLCATPSPRVVLDSPERIVGGVDAWIVQTWAILAQKHGQERVRLVERGEAGALCVFHYDHATLRNGVHLSYSVVVRADRPPVPLADTVIEQNPAVHENRRVRYIPHWPQPGLIPRNRSRGGKIERLAYVGSDMYLPAYMQTADFKDALAAMGVEFVHMLNGNWRDHSTVDVLVAARDVPACVLEVKPASKLVNAWMAGVPIILNEEPAYEALRESPADYLSAHDARTVLSAVNLLVSDPETYAAMVANGDKRMVDYSPEKIVSAWDGLFTSLENSASSRLTGGMRLCRKAEWIRGKVASRVWRVLRGWRD